MTDVRFQTCVGALNDVLGAYRDGRKTISTAPGKYEADMAAFRLMQLVWVHVNSISALAEVPTPGSHLVAAWPLVRAAYETGLTAWWLVKDDDWKEREARWLGWMAGEEKFQDDLANDFDSCDPDAARKRRAYRDSLKGRREAITKLLPKDSLTKRPSIFALVKELMPGQNYYVPYRIASQLTHAGPGAMDWMSKHTDDGYTDIIPEPQAWANMFSMASWCIAQPGAMVLARAKADNAFIRELLEAHERVLRCSKQLGGEAGGE
jgi:Family of unknown function (DUF5677)